MHISYNIICKCIYKYIYTYIPNRNLINVHTYQLVLSMSTPFPSVSSAILLTQICSGATQQPASLSPKHQAFCEIMKFFDTDFFYFIQYLYCISIWKWTLQSFTKSLNITSLYYSAQVHRIGVLEHVQTIQPFLPPKHPNPTSPPFLQPFPSLLLSQLTWILPLWLLRHMW